jgi:hypothetical protein
MKVPGKVEFRVASVPGAEPVDGESIAHVKPGDEVTLRVQMRTEVPLNEVYFELRWPSGTLQCVDPVGKLLFTNPEDGVLYPPDDKQLWCYDSFRFGDGAHRARFALVGADLRSSLPPYVDRPFAHFLPLGAWTDLTEVKLRVPANARGGSDIPLRFRPASPESGIDTIDRDPRADFMPYGARQSCDTTERTDDAPDAWAYDLVFHEASIAVIGEGEPDPDPADGGIRVIIGSATARPGETVEVPVYASAVSSLTSLRLALGVDPLDATVDAIACRFQDRVFGVDEWVTLHRGERASRVYCDDPNAPPDTRICKVGLPFMAIFQDTDARQTLADFLAADANTSAYPGAAPMEVARLLVHVREDTKAVEIPIPPVVVTWTPGEFPVESVTGGLLYPEQQTFAPASEVQPGTIRILGRGFLRGDANRDGKVDLSDAVAALGFLFLGTGEPACLDAADADDSGVVEITDAIYLLGALFLGTKSVPEPYPACGNDPTADALGCKEGCP